jgi:GNAT superfamily N-acetyltransferase
MENLIKSRLFDIVAHPDSIKCFGHEPGCDLSQTYEKIADLLNEYEMYAEQSAGLFINYGFDELGMNKRMLKIFKDKGVKVLTVSDAHRPDDVGRFIREMSEGNTVGITRIVGDDATVFYIQDVIVNLAYQGKGVGHVMMKAVMNYIYNIACSGAVVGLMSAKGKEGFYKRYGFWERPNENFGAGMMQFWERKEEK